MMHYLDTTLTEVIPWEGYPRLKEKSIQAKLGGFLGDWKFTENIENFHKLVCLPAPSVHT